VRAVVARQDAAVRSLAQLEALETVALEDARRRVERVLDVARELLGMEIAYFSEFTQTHQVMKRVSGDAGSFGFAPGTAIPLEETYCRRMVAGEIPNAIENAREHGGVRELPPTLEADMGSYIGVPLQLSDGRVYGTLCCASHRAHDELAEQDVRFMRVLGRLLADELDREHALAQVAPLEGAEVEDEDVVARLSLWFAGAPKAAPAARRALESLSDHVEPARLYDLNLLVTELVTNAVRHAGIGPASAVGLEVVVRAERLRVTVSDPGPGFEPAVPGADELDALDEHGRGLFIVEQLASRWGVMTNGPGTRVWLEIDAA
jgi:anti-sigma regulatory factor (Ser/Thr protein kinase)